VLHQVWPGKKVDSIKTSKLVYYQYKNIKE
jgi:hypothetical protein